MMITLSYPDLVTVMSLPRKLGPLNPISIREGRAPPDDNHSVLVHGDVVAPDHVLLELHSHVIIKKDQHEISGYYQLNLYFA